MPYINAIEDIQFSVLLLGLNIRVFGKGLGVISEEQRKGNFLISLIVLTTRAMRVGEGIRIDITSISICPHDIARRRGWKWRGNSERASGRLGRRAQSPPKPRRDRFVVLLRENERERVYVSACIQPSRRVECTVTHAGRNFSRTASFPVISGCQ